MTTSKNYIIHLAQYHETDQMRVVHHVNYVKWMEEARHHYLEYFGININEIESQGIFMPVLSQSVNYLKAIRYGEEIRINCICNKCNGIKISFEYTFESTDGKVLYAKGQTEHGFVDNTFKPIIFKNIMKKEYNLLKKEIDKAKKLY